MDVELIPIELALLGMAAFSWWNLWLAARRDEIMVPRGLRRMARTEFPFIYWTSAALYAVLAIGLTALLCGAAYVQIVGHPL